MIDTNFAWGLASKSDQHLGYWAGGYSAVWTNHGVMPSTLQHFALSDPAKVFIWAVSCSLLIALAIYLDSLCKE